MPAHKLSIKEVEKRFKDKNLILLSEYIGKRYKVEAKCYCGNNFIVRPDKVFSGDTISCGCLAQECRRDRCNKTNITGKRFGKLVALEFVRIEGKNRPRWKCLCDCGQVCYPHYCHLTAKNEKKRVISCGCQTFKNGRATSSCVTKLVSQLGHGVHNYQTNCGINIDIWTVINGKKIAIEYDEWYWHRKYIYKDKAKTALLIKNGWKVLRIKTHRVTPNIQDVQDKINILANTDMKLQVIKLGQWGKLYA